MGEHPSTHTPVTHDNYSRVAGPFYHGTKSSLEVGAELVPGHGSNFHDGRVSNNIYFTALVETAAWGAELASALAGSGERGHIYVVEPMGPFEDDPNVTNKRFPGNPTPLDDSRPIPSQSCSPTSSVTALRRFHIVLARAADREPASPGGPDGPAQAENGVTASAVGVTHP